MKSRQTKLSLVTNMPIANTCVGRDNMILLHKTAGFKVNVSAYSLECAMLKDISIASCTGAYNLESDGSTTYLLEYGMRS
jgi:hypothetical protein